MSYFQVKDFLSPENLKLHSDTDFLSAKHTFNKGLKMASKSAKITIDHNDVWQCKTSDHNFYNGQFGKDSYSSELMKSFLESGVEITLFRKENDDIIQYDLQKGHPALVNNQQQEIAISLKNDYENIYLLDPLKTTPLDGQITQIAEFYELKDNNRLLSYGSVSIDTENEGVYINKATDSAFILSNNDLMNIDIQNHVKKVFDEDTDVIVDKKLYSNEKTLKEITIKDKNYKYYETPRQTPSDQRKVFVAPDRDIDKIISKKLDNKNERRKILKR